MLSRGHESYVHPVMVASEAPHPWVAVWRFRVTMLALSSVLAAVAIVFVQLLNGNYQGQDPTFEPGGANLNAPVASTSPGTSHATKSPAAGNLGGGDGESTTAPKSTPKASAPAVLGGPG